MSGNRTLPTHNRQSPRNNYTYDPTAFHRNTTIIAVDGACRSNGYQNSRASIGVVVESKPELNFAALLPDGTTNQAAELHAGLAGLGEAKNLSSRRDHANGDPELVVIKSDSAYLVNGMTEWTSNWERNGYRSANGQLVVNQNLFRSLREEVREIEDTGTKVQFWHVPRAQNSEADALANWALNGS